MPFYDVEVSIYGLSGEAWSPKGTLIVFLYLFKIAVAITFLTRDKRIIQIAYVDAMLSLILWVVFLFHNIYLNGQNTMPPVRSINLEIFLLIPYLMVMQKIKQSSIRS
ncbi:hypothetical protein IWX76_002607 [Pedobacter sp. CAN_A7]